MPRITCSDCKLKFEFSRDEDICICPNQRCRKEQPTGMESRIRRRIEKYCNDLELPAMTVGRAVGFAAGIYEMSTHNDRIDTGSIERRLERKTGRNTGMTKASLKLLATRANGGLVDNRTGLMIYVVSGNSEGRDWNTAFVVFRGSRGTVGGSEANPLGAGWDDSTGESHNLDWAANFTNAQVEAPWRTGVRIHKGFLAIYSSVGQIIRDEVQKLKAQIPGLQVVVTGHSLGAALATLCAHDLQNSTSIRPFCYPFCPPKTGNLAFAEDFSLHIASRVAPIDAEPGGRYYSRGISFVQSSDPVSWGGKKAFKRIRAASIQAIADSGNTVKQGIYSARKTKSKIDIYYLAPNVYKVAVLGFHSYNKMEKDLLGAR
jgi:hypothetical protein